MTLSLDYRLTDPWWHLVQRQYTFSSLYAGNGTQLYHVCINHLFYADDLCLMATSPAGLQHFINICANYGFENDINYCLTAVNPRVWL